VKERRKQKRGPTKRGTESKKKTGRFLFGEDPKSVGEGGGTMKGRECAVGGVLGKKY